MNYFYLKKKTSERENDPSLFSSPLSIGKKRERMILHFFFLHHCPQSNKTWLRNHKIIIGIFFVYIHLLTKKYKLRKWMWKSSPKNKSRRQGQVW